ncbi:HELB isoform 7 [Pan troglodytes]|uniref:HELB isoform 7 n=1 Tax=Pan troglodytes TaxID=9598 RepID=A0A2J8K0A4_PANTR|nr:HELB isoform 7 [Pan troglodytes]
MARSSPYLRQLQGPLLPPRDLVEEDDDYLNDDVEEDEESVFIDAEELCSGGVKAGSLPGCLRVSICDENTQETCKVFGRFPITGAWWRVKGNTKNFPQGNWKERSKAAYTEWSGRVVPRQ